MYYILVMRDTYINKWFIEFGDFDKWEVIAEMLYNINQGVKAADLNVIKSPAADQKTIDEIVNKLNKEG